MVLSHVFDYIVTLYLMKRNNYEYNYFVIYVISVYVTSKLLSFSLNAKSIGIYKFI